MHRIVIVGGGMAGLAAAWELSRVPDLQVTVLEGSDRVGGKLRRQEIAGQWVDVGAESMLAVREEAVELIREIGAGELLVTPATTAATVYAHGALHPLPPRSMMGIPRRPEDAAGILTPAQLERLAASRPLPPLSGDISVADYVGAALGPAVVERLVEPLLGGVYAGHADRLSLAATMPAVYAKAVAGEALWEPEATLPEPPGSAGSPAGRPGAVFAGLRGGLGALPELLSTRLRERGVRILSTTMVRELRRLPGAGGRWQVVSGPTTATLTHTADAVLVATPPPATRRLLDPVAGEAARLIAEIPQASMAVITFAFAAGDWARAGVPEGSGFLVPPIEGRPVKAATFSSQKWEWLAQQAPQLVFARASMGRQGEEEVLQHPDAQLAATALGELRDILSCAVPDPVAGHVQRWGGGLPQYAVGHLDRVAAIRTALAEVAGLAVAGAAYDGVGVPAVIGSGRRAARVLAGQLGLRD